MTRNISELRCLNYGDTVNGVQFDCEPSWTDIQTAIDNRQFETRNYQDDLNALIAEWAAGSNNGHNRAEWERLAKQYHARRIAYFVVNGWTVPIVIDTSELVRDGTHRFKAAKHKGNSTIEVNDTVLPA